MPKARTERTVWEVRTYDVWGNDDSGWEVNDTYALDPHLVLDLPVKRRQTGAPWDRAKGEFLCCEISERQIREALGLHRCQLDIDGDDTHVTVNRRKDGYPLGELYCTSHDSLAPIRAHDQEPEGLLCDDWQAPKNTLPG